MFGTAFANILKHVNNVNRLRKFLVTSLHIQALQGFAAFPTVHISNSRLWAADSEIPDLLFPTRAKQKLVSKLGCLFSLQLMLDHKFLSS